MPPVSDERLDLACRLNHEFPLGSLRDRPPQRATADRYRIPLRLIQTAEQNRFGRNHLLTLEQLRDRNPELQVELWDAKQRDAYMRERWGQHPMGGLYARACFGAMRADLFRYCVIHDQGGFYLDINKLLIQPLLSFVTSESDGLISFEQTWCQLPAPARAAQRLSHADRYVVQWCFGFRAGHPLLTMLLEAIVAQAATYEGRQFNNPGEAIRSLTGPGIFTATVRHYLEQHNDRHLVQAGIDFQGTLRYPAGRDVMHLIAPHYKTARDQVILKTPAQQAAEQAHAHGLAAQQRGALDDAKAAYRTALLHQPGRIRSLNNLAVLAMQEGNLEEAEARLQQALSQKPRDPELLALVLNSGSQWLLRKHQPAQARRWSQQRTQLRCDATSFTTLSMAYRDAGQLAAAERSQRRALGLQPHEDPIELLSAMERNGANGQRWLQLQNLAVLQLERDPWRWAHWRLLEARLGRLPAERRNLWRGEATDALLVWDEQGFGDALQCLRWLPLVLERCKQVTLRLRPALLPLAKTWLEKQRLPTDGQLQWQLQSQGDPLPGEDGGLHCPLMSLPVALRLDGIDALARPAAIEPALTPAHALPRPGQIGLVWAAGATPDADAQCRSEQRSLPAEVLVPVLNQLLGNSWQGGNCELINLQQDRPVPDHPLLRRHLPAAIPCGDWLDTARLVEQLDGVITVDTAMAHLCGLLARPTTLILNHPCDWRWEQSGSQSPWYPSLHLRRERWQPSSWT